MANTKDQSRAESGGAWNRPQASLDSANVEMRYNMGSVMQKAGMAAAQDISDRVPRKSPILNGAYDTMNDKAFSK